MANELERNVSETKWNYDVYLSFRGSDTRLTFTGNLYNALRHARFRTWMDVEGLKGGDQIISSLFQALRSSRISLVVLSETFAFSTFCLDELVQILDCRNMNNQLVLPIFYQVEPSDVRRQQNSFRDAMEAHERRFGRNSEKVHIWRSALSQVANLCGFHIRRGDVISVIWEVPSSKSDLVTDMVMILTIIMHGYEYQYIEQIVEWVTEKVPRYDIFLSFSGIDTRYSFTGFLCNALRRAGFRTFMNDGDQISQSVIEAIERSRLSIIVFSENYAYSSSCLDELVAILECMKTNNQVVWPIFYKVEPSDLRHQRNSYGKAMIEHENRLGKESQKVEQWKSALSQVANLKGWHLKTGYEYELIKKITEAAIKI